jgi:hypothetical protein
MRNSAVTVRSLRKWVLRDIQDEHGGVTQHEHPEAGIPGTRECGDVHGVAGMLTLAALRAVGAAGCSW